MAANVFPHVADMPVQMRQSTPGQRRKGTFPLEAKTIANPRIDQE
jgi:hypothetical protein